MHMLSIYAYTVLQHGKVLYTYSLLDLHIQIETDAHALLSVTCTTTALGKLQVS